MRFTGLIIATGSLAVVAAGFGAVASASPEAGGPACTYPVAGTTSSTKAVADEAAPEPSVGTAGVLTG